MNSFWVLVAVILVAFWLWSGILAYGITYAYLQRHFHQKTAARYLYVDMLVAAKYIPIGFLGLARSIRHRRIQGAWDEDNNRPVYGLKFLPRHEYRRKKEVDDADKA